MQLARSSRRACVAFGNFIFFCFFCCFLLFLPGTIFIVMPYRTALVLSSKMASSANTGPWYEPARQRGYLNFGVCLGFICWDVNIHLGSEQFFGGSAMPRVYLPIVSASSLVVFWQQGLCNFFRRDQKKTTTLNSKSQLR